jgi:hypothetical protein
LRSFDHRWWMVFAILLFPALGHGAIVCATCHPKETALYSGSPMGNSLGPPTPVRAGRIVHQRSESAITVEPGAKMIHRLSERGLTAEYAIDYQIGAGILAHSYITQVNGYLFESPATWFRSSGWDVSPGYARAPAIDFDRPITETCLFCHAGAAKFSGSDGRRLADTKVASITCERCHGPSEEHLRHPSAGNIVNPGKLAARARDSVCEQCHLEGAVRVLNPGKSWAEFHPGENFERTVAVYVLNQKGNEVRAVSQFEQLALSKCASRSGGQLWCGTCHKSHGPPADRNREIRGVCTACHATLSKAAHPNSQPECVSCHMPRLATEFAHVAVTDHRILRRPGVPVEDNETRSQTLAAWVDPPAVFRQRDLILANLTAGHRQGLATIRLAGLSLLDVLPSSQRDADSALLAAACEAMLDQGMLQKAVEACRRAEETQPESADRAMTLGIALNRSGDLAGAERQLNNAIRLDPSLKHAYVELWTLYDGQNKTREKAETADRFLRWNPRNIMFRVLKGASVHPPNQ